MPTQTDQVLAPSASEPTADRVLLTAADRCDHGACGAQARAIAVMTSGADLLFCMHHAEALSAKLTSAGAVLDTQYEPLGVKVSSSV